MRQFGTLKGALLAAAALMVVPQVAYAQDSGGSGDKADDANKTGDIVVTAQRRAESVQKTSLAIDVLSSDKIQKSGLTQPTELSTLLPGVQVSQGGNTFQIYIRGVGSFNSTPLSDSAVAQSVDGVFASTTQAIAGSMFDIQRIELLKGPQGTLYGRNASGGALNIIPTAPRLDEFGGYVSIDGQNYNGITVEGAVNLPISKSLAGRVSFQTVSRDGYLDDGTNDDKHQSVRVQLLYQPNDWFNAKLFGSYQHIGGRGAGYALYEPNATAFGGAIVPANRWTSPLPELNDRLALLNLALTGGASSTALFSPFDSKNIRQDNRIWDVHAQFDVNLDFATLTFIPAYQDVTLDYWSIPALNYSTYVDGDGPEYVHATSMELRLGNANRRIKWVVGGFFYNSDSNANQTVNFGPAVNQVFTGALNTRSYAAFGEATVSVTNAFRLIGGLRYTDETKTVDAHQYNGFGSLACPIAGTGPAGACQVLAVNGKYSASKLTYRAGFEFDVGPQNMLFGTVGTGFKSGGQTVSAFPPYEPETVAAYTLGSTALLRTPQTALPCWNRVDAIATPTCVFPSVSSRRCPTRR